MPATRLSRRSQQKDQQIHAALVAGFSPAQVAQRFELAVEQVQAANNRVLHARAKLSQREADLEKQRTRLDAVFEVAMEGYQRSVTACEQTTKASTDPAKPGTKVERGTKTKIADPRFLKMALEANVQLVALLRLDEPAPPPSEHELAMKQMQETHSENARLHPDLFDNLRHAQKELLAGRKLPRFDLPEDEPESEDVDDEEPVSDVPCNVGHVSNVPCNGMDQSQDWHVGNVPHEDFPPSPQAVSCNPDAGRSMAPSYVAKGESMLTSTAFKQGEPIPQRHTGEGGNVSPQLAWSGLPAETQELALICDDPDAPSRAKPGQEPWVHWLLYNLPATLKELPEGIVRTSRLASPAGARQGLNSWESDNTGYLGPMPPNGSGPHRYYFKLYALDTKLDLPPATATKAVLLAAMQGHVLAELELMGTYERK